jgi:bacterioferritin-associated ferredoxin
MTTAQIRAGFTSVSIAASSAELAARLPRSTSCGRCGRWDRPTRMKAAPTGNHFCVDEKACARRADRRVTLAGSRAQMAVAQ